MSLLDTIHAVFGDIFRISQGYSSKHDGLDLAAPIGTPVKAVVAGTVEYARDARVDPNCLNAWSCGGGNVVNINIGGNKATQYAHLSKIMVSSGSRVEKGQVIGLVGDTGGKNPDGSYGGAGARFVGAHVHFGLWDKTASRMINPDSFLRAVATNGQINPNKVPETGIDPSSLLPNVDIAGAVMFVAVILVGIAFLGLAGLIALKGSK